MSLSSRFLPAALLLFAPAALLAQPPATAAASAEAAPGSASQAQLPSALLNPALAQIRLAISMLRPEAWKLPAPVKQETTQNIGSIQRDLDNTLTGLLAAADKNPASVSEVLPAYRNVEALYDVLLRVDLVAQITAPPQQSVPLNQATSQLETVRRTLGDQIQTNAGNSAHAIVVLQGQLRTAQASLAQAAATPAPICPTPPPAKKRVTPKPKPAPASTSAPAASTPH